MGLRRLARECALQMLYQLDVGKHPRSEIAETFWLTNEHQAKVREFATELFRGTAERQRELDALIQKHARNWRLARMAAVDRNILRMAVFELVTDRTPGTVVINEALEIAKKYSTSESAQFVNGILDSIKNELLERVPVADE